MQPSTSHAEARSTRTILTVLFVGVLMGALDIAIVGPALPAIRRHFGVDDRASAWIFTIYVLFNLLGAPFMSKLSDRYGRRPIYLLDVALFALGSLGVALAPAFGVLLAARALQGISAGGIWPVASAVIGDTFPRERQGRALGLIGAVFGLAFIIGPILGGVLLRFGWEWLFLINLPVAAWILWMAARVLPATRAPAPKPFDLAGMAVLAVFLTGLTFAINQLDTEHLLSSLTSLRVWPWLVLALLAAPLLWRLEQRAVDPVVHPELLRNRQLRLAYLLSLGAGLGEAAMVFLPALAVAAFGVGESQASFLLLPVVLGVTVGSPLGGRLLDAIGPRPVIVGGVGLLAAGMFGMGLWGTQFTLFLVSGVLIGLGLASLLGAPIRYIVLAEAPRDERAAAQGMVTIATGVGQLVSGAFVGAVAASRGGGVTGYTFAYTLIGVVTLGLMVMGFQVKRRYTAVVEPVDEGAGPVDQVSAGGD